MDRSAQYLHERISLLIDFEESDHRVLVEPQNGLVTEQESGAAVPENPNGVLGLEALVQPDLGPHRRDLSACLDIALDGNSPAKPVIVFLGLAG
jgi:hypothetical protein